MKTQGAAHGAVARFGPDSRCLGCNARSRHREWCTLAGGLGADPSVILRTAGIQLRASRTPRARGWDAATVLADAARDWFGPVQARPVIATAYGALIGYLGSERGYGALLCSAVRRFALSHDHFTAASALISAGNWFSGQHLTDTGDTGTDLVRAYASVPGSARWVLGTTTVTREAADGQVTAIVRILPGSGPLAALATMSGWGDLAPA